MATPGFCCHPWIYNQSNLLTISSRPEETHLSFLEEKQVDDNCNRSSVHTFHYQTH